MTATAKNATRQACISFTPISLETVIMDRHMYTLNDAAKDTHNPLRPHISTNGTIRIRYVAAQEMLSERLTHILPSPAIVALARSVTEEAYPATVTKKMMSSAGPY